MNDTTAGAVRAGFHQSELDGIPGDAMATTAHPAAAVSNQLK
jgi:hypothetical protein